MLSPPQRSELEQLRQDGDRFMLRKAQAAVLLRWRGHSVISPNSSRIRLVKLQQLFGCWRDQPDLVEIFQGIESDRIGE